MSAIEHIDLDTTEQTSIVFTDAAAAKVRELVQEEKNPNLNLRVYVQGNGGCSGYEYGFSFEEGIQENDTAIERDGVKLLIDAASYKFLLGAQIDYIDDAQGAQFVINNPNVKTGCDCGA